MFGLGKGKINIQLEKANYIPGETVAGKISMQLKRPVKGKAVTVRLSGEYKQRTYRQGKSYSKTVYVFDFQQQLDTEKEYSATSKEYNFKIKIPKNVLDKKEIPGALGKVVGVLQAFSGQSRIRWFVTARLDVPWGVDVKKTVEINVTKE